MSALSPKLAAFTDAQSADYVTVLVSGDANEEAFEGYRRARVGCLAVPFRSPHRQMLMSAFRIFAIPRASRVAPDDGQSRHRLGTHRRHVQRGRVRAGLAQGEQGYSMLGSLLGIGKLPQCAPPGL